MLLSYREPFQLYALFDHGLLNGVPAEAMLSDLLEQVRDIWRLQTREATRLVADIDLDLGLLLRQAETLLGVQLDAYQVLFGENATRSCHTLLRGSE